MLLDRFGTIVNALRQTREPGAIAALVGSEVTARLVYLGASLEQSLREEAIHGLQLGSLEAVTQYLRACMADQNCETFRAFFLDGENRLLDDRVMWVGTVDRVQAHPRELVRTALSLGAVAVLVAHNHVSAPPRPSPEDLLFTAKLVNAFASLELRLNDHIIVGRNGCFSMRASGLLNSLEARDRLTSSSLDLVV